jgi:hypothetical protein
MPNDPSARAAQAARDVKPADWRRPAFELFALDCEITAYAPDGDTPLV